jgi:hypothetical protein
VRAHILPSWHAERVVVDLLLLGEGSGRPCATLKESLGLVVQVSNVVHANSYVGVDPLLHRVAVIDQR